MAQTSNGVESGIVSSPAAALVHCPTILLTDELGSVLSVSTGGHDTAPEGTGQLLGQPWRSLFKGMRQVSLPKAPEPEQHVFVGTEGQGAMTYWVQCRPAHSSGRGAMFVLVEPVAGDALVERLAHCERLFAMGQLADRVVHEINNALTIASAQMQLLKKAAPPNPAMRKGLDIVAEEVNRIAQIAKNVQAHAKVPAPVQQPVDINEVISGVLMLQSYQMKTENIELAVDLPPNPPTILADEGRLRQVFLNLVLNARRAMPSGGYLSISATNDDDWLYLCVADTGCGIPEQNREKIFEPYFTTRPYDGGTGLGLAVSQQYVERMGGAISLESTVDEGSAFTVKLPIMN